MQFHIRATFLQVSVMLASAIFFNAAYAQPLITFDSATGNYNFIYQKQDDSGAATGVFTPGSKFIFPGTRSAFTLSAVDTMVYRLRLLMAAPPHRQLAMFSLMTRLFARWWERCWNLPTSQ